MLNWSLAKNPVNWFTILLMVIIAGMAGQLALSYFGVEPKTAES